MPLTLKGSTSGGVTIDVPATAGNNTLTFPAATGTALVGTTTTANQIFFGGATSGTLSQSSNLFWDSANNQLDLGAGTQSLPALSTVGDNNTGIYFPAADTIGLSTNGSVKMSITSAGLVGIGTTSPTSTLDVNGSIVSGYTASGQEITVYNGDTTNAQRLRLNMSGTDAVITATRAAGTVPNMIFRIDANERMRITSTGNLEVGQGTAATSLFVYGNVSGSKNSYIKLTDTSGSSIGMSAVVGGTATLNLEGGSGSSYFNGGGSVGIGTASPLTKLDVNGIGRFVQTAAPTTGAVILRQNSGDTFGATLQFVNNSNSSQTGAISVSPTGVMSFWNIGASNLTLDASGNLGLGVTPSAWSSAYKVFDVGSIGSVANSTNVFGVFTNAYVNASSNYIYKNTNYATMYLQNAGGTGQHQWHIAPSGTANAAITFTQAMTLDASGNLGIGTTSPSYPLTVISQNSSAVGVSVQGRSSDNLGGLIFFSNNGGTNYASFLSSSTEFRNTSASGVLTYYTGGSERMRITSNGHINLCSSANTLRAVNFYANEYSFQFPSGNAYYFNLSDNSGNNGANQSFVIRGLTSNGAGQATLAGFSVFATTSSFSGSISKGSGSFKIDHPLPELTDTHYLVHSFIEGPQADLIYRGVAQLVNGSATINIDEVAGMTEGTFDLMCREVQCFTCNETDWDAVRGKVEGNILIIESENGSSTASISWLVIGERKDKHMLETGWTDNNGKVIVEPVKPPSIQSNTEAA